MQETVGDSVINVINWYLQQVQRISDIEQGRLKKSRSHDLMNAAAVDSCDFYFSILFKLSFFYLTWRFLCILGWSYIVGTMMLILCVISSHLCFLIVIKFVKKLRLVSDSLSTASNFWSILKSQISSAFKWARRKNDVNEMESAANQSHSFTVIVMFIVISLLFMIFFIFLLIKLFQEATFLVESVVSITSKADIDLQFKEKAKSILENSYQNFIAFIDAELAHRFPSKNITLSSLYQQFEMIRTSKDMKNENVILLNYVPHLSKFIGMIFSGNLSALIDLSLISLCVGDVKRLIEELLSSFVHFDISPLYNIAYKTLAFIGNFVNGTVILNFLSNSIFTILQIFVSGFSIWYDASNVVGSNLSCFSLRFIIFYFVTEIP